MRATRALTALVLTLIFSGKASARPDAEVSEPSEASRCAGDGLPKAFCDLEGGSYLLMYNLWTAASDRLDRDEWDGLFMSVDPGEEGYGGSLEAVTLVDANPPTDTPRPPHWKLLRRSISTRDIGALADRSWDPVSLDARAKALGLADYNAAFRANRADEVLPDVRRLAASLPVTVTEADVATCPGLRAKLDELEPLLAQSVDIAGVGRDGQFTARNTFDDAIRKLRVRGYIARLNGSITYSVETGHPLAAWQDEIFAVAAPCWRPSAPESQ